MKEAVRTSETSVYFNETTQIYVPEGCHTRCLENLKSDTVQVMLLCYPTTRHGDAMGERMHSSYSFTTSALDGGEWSASRPGRALAPGKGPPVPIVHEAGWASEPVWTQRLEEKSFRLCRGSNLDRRVVQSVVRHYTDWATRLTSTRYVFSNLMSYVECLNFKVKHLIRSHHVHKIYWNVSAYSKTLSIC
jgi:hypothetical protein